MLGIVQIALCVVAWLRGWGARALIPLAAALGAGFGLGFLGGALELDLDALFVVLLACDVLVIGVQIAMIAFAPGRDGRSEEPVAEPDTGERAEALPAT